MILKKVEISNYRSIEKLKIDINQLSDKSYTYGLIGVNEAGKSSILKALALKDSIRIIKPNLKDFRDLNKPIEVTYSYTLSSKEAAHYKKLLYQIIEERKGIQINLSEIKLRISINKTTLQKVDYNLLFPSLLISDEKIIKKIESLILLEFRNNTHNSIFWVAEDKFLISKPINLQNFANSPNSTSIPLKNCFKLAGIDNISERISLLSDSTEREHLQDDLGEIVTNYINKVWKKHPIKITFNISDSLINFHVKDLNSKGKAKTVDQRSDGFKQFISFLLTISVQNMNDDLSNSILLLDEPETHLHPKAQQNLLEELVNITKSRNNNITFFATHSNYMVDKNELSRNYKVEKPKDETVLKMFTSKNSTYASVNFEVFDIISTDYHNELFSEAFYLSGLESLTKFDKKINEINNGKYSISKEYIKGKKKFDCTLCTYIRHQIHHPENKENARYTESELEKSIKLLLIVIEKLKK